MKPVIAQVRPHRATRVGEDEVNYPMRAARRSRLSRARLLDPGWTDCPCSVVPLALALRKTFEGRVRVCGSILSLAGSIPSMLFVMAASQTKETLEPGQAKGLLLGVPVEVGLERGRRYGLSRAASYTLPYLWGRWRTRSQWPLEARECI